MAQEDSVRQLHAPAGRIEVPKVLELITDYVNDDLFVGRRGRSIGGAVIHLGLVPFLSDFVRKTALVTAHRQNQYSSPSRNFGFDGSRIRCRNNRSTPVP